MARERDGVWVWVTPVPSLATQKGQGASRSWQCWQCEVKGNSPLSQRSTRQGFKEGNQIAAYNFALSMFWILRVCLIKGILCR